MSPRRLRNAELNEAAKRYDGPYRPYDIVKEVAVCTGVVALLAIVLTVLFSSPDLPPSTIKGWSRSMPADFVTTALTELDGSSDTAQYGPPYNNASGGQQHIAFIHIETWLGVTHPVNARYDFVIQPLRAIPDQPSLQAAVTSYLKASPSSQARWTDAYSKALAKAKTVGAAVIVPSGSYGPVATMMSALLALAQSGGLDGDLLTSRQFYQTDYTKSLLLLADGNNLTDRAMTQHLLGTQWGIMNETGSYPGQVWLWLYTFWYQVSPFTTSANADALVATIMGVLSLGLILVPFIPGIRDIPRLVPVYRLIWRDWYGSGGGSPTAAGEA
jgi:hypothetical protein